MDLTELATISKYCRNFGLAIPLPQILLTSKLTFLLLKVIFSMVS